MATEEEEVKYAWLVELVFKKRDVACGGHLWQPISQFRKMQENVGRKQKKMLVENKRK